MFLSQGPGTFVISLSEAVVALKHLVSAAEVFPVRPNVLQTAPVAAGTGFSSGRH